MALSPDEKLIAVAGYGRKEADVVVLDRASGKVAASLSAESHKSYLTASTVWSLAFDVAGKRLAVGHENGSVWVWTVEGPGQGSLMRAAGPVEDDQAIANRRAKVVWLAFAGDAVRFARGNGTVFETVGPNSQPRELFRFSYPISRAITPKDGRWLAGCPLLMTDTGTRIELRYLPQGKILHTVEFSKNQRMEHQLLPVSLAVDDRGHKLAVATWWPAVSGIRFSPLQYGDVRVYDLTSTRPNLIAAAIFDGKDGRPALRPDAIAIDSTGQRLAVAGGPNHETRLWRIEGATLRPVGEPAVGVGRGVWQVGTRADGTIICFRQTPNPTAYDPNNRGTGPWRCFDLSRLSWTETESPQITAQTELGGWRVEIDPHSEFHWFVRYREERWPLPIDKNQDDRPTCYTFLPGAQPRQVYLAVGFYRGFKLFELRRATRPKLVARGIGHSGAITSIVPARDGKMLITGSSDQTIGLWSLQPWDHHPILGAKLTWKVDEKTQQRQFTVAAVQLGSPAWEMGLLAGDRITQVGYDVTWIQDPTSWEEVIDRAEPGKELVFITDRQPKGTKSQLLTRPQAKLFPTAGHDWVLYRYVDYYYASSTNGDTYLGWLIGGKIAADTPEYYPATRFHKIFHRPDSVRDSIGQLVREPDQPLIRKYIPPSVFVRASNDTTIDKPVSLSIIVKPRADEKAKTIPLEKVELWLDDEVLLRSWPNTGEKDFRTTVLILPHELRVGSNRLTVVGHARTRGEASVEVWHTPKMQTAVKLRGIAVGVDQYPYLADNAQLQAAVNDAQLIKIALEGLEKDQSIHSANVELLVNEKATPAAIYAKIAAAGKDLGPDDWLVIFLAGHGMTELEVKPPIPPRVRHGTWFFCGSPPTKTNVGGNGQVGAVGERQVFDLAKLSTAATQRDVDALIGGLKQLDCTISGRELLDQLNKLNCRKLVLLDSCHSGAIRQQDPGRDLRPDGRGAIVITASAPDETASEFDLSINLGDGLKTARHGFFTVAVFNALGPHRAAADRNGDGLLTLEELQRAVADSVRETRRKLGLDRAGRSQTVLASPPDLRNIVFVGSQ
jgi:WD40 repeat protein